MAKEFSGKAARRFYLPAIGVRRTAPQGVSIGGQNFLRNVQDLLKNGGEIVAPKKNGAGLQEGSGCGLRLGWGHKRNEQKGKLLPRGNKKPETGTL